ncbi:MAG: aldo/keto reductase [Sphingomonadales bacterium]|nr:MAG: aldo/keto reductase [Sphingomonadales bacterium]
MFEAIDEATAAATLEAAWDAGIRYFDTAPHYGSGLSEHRLGAALRGRPRDAFVLSTKVGKMLRPDPDGPPNPPFQQPLPFRMTLDYGYDAAMRSVEDSCHRLGLARIDIAFVHDLAEDALGDAWIEHLATARHGAFRALSELREQGVIRAWGIGVNRIEPCLRALDEADPDLFLLAGRYSLLEQPAAATLFPRCLERGVQVVVGGPYNSGLLAGGRNYDYRAAPPELIARRDRIAVVCNGHGIDVRAAALRFCAAHPAVAAVIPGAKHAGKVRENAALMKAVTPAALWDELKAEQLIPADIIVPRDETPAAPAVS